MELFCKNPSCSVFTAEICTKSETERKEGKLPTMCTAHPQSMVKNMVKNSFFFLALGFGEGSLFAFK